MSVLLNSGPPPQTPSKRLFENGGLTSDLPFNLKHRKVDGGRSFPEKYNADESNEQDLRTLTEVIVETENYFNYPRLGYRTNCGETNGEKCLTVFNEDVSPLGETGKDCGLKDVALKCVTNINGDTEPRIDDQNPEGLINHKIFYHKERRGANVDGGWSFPEKCGATFEDSEINEHNLSEVTVQTENYLNYSSAGQNCGLKDVVLKYDTNIEIQIEGGDTESRIDDQNHQECLVNLKCGATFEDNEINEHNLSEVTVQTENYLNDSSAGQDCGLKDVALKYDTNIEIQIEGGDTESRIDYQNHQECSVNLKCGATFEDNEINEHNLSEVTVQTENYLNDSNAGQNCGLKDVALKYDTDIKIPIEGGDIESRIGDQNHQECLVNLKCGATFEDNESNEHNLRTLTEVNVDYLNYSNVGYSTNSRGFTDLNEDCGLKDVVLKYDTNIEICVAEDITGGKERFPIRAMNGVDYSQPPTFTYVNQMIYPSWYKKIEPKGCKCVKGCSDDSRKCICIVKNKGEIPFNENGCITKVRARVHECGPKCKCPPTCMNRVSQRGPRIRLEIFKTENRGWGVRSPEIIRSGGFVGEYIGEFMREKDADMRVGGDEYLFDVCKGGGPGKSGNGFSIDAGVYGNVGRFFNHSCSPNMYAQKVIYDHDDPRMPHIMFFATRDIPPMEELSYDYNYRLGMVCDADGNIKIKECYCGSRKCRKRLY